MNVELSSEELVLVLDGLAALPLSRSYNLFNKMYALTQKPAESIPVPPTPEDTPL
jgi:hypothetical protein